MAIPTEHARQADIVVDEYKVAEPVRKTVKPRRVCNRPTLSDLLAVTSKEAHRADGWDEMPLAGEEL